MNACELSRSGAYAKAQSAVFDGSVSKQHKDSIEGSGIESESEAGDDQPSHERNGK